MLTYKYPHKPPRKIKVTICNHQAESPMCGLMSDLVICEFRKGIVEAVSTVGMGTSKLRVPEHLITVTLHFL